MACRCVTATGTGTREEVVQHLARAIRKWTERTIEAPRHLDWTDELAEHLTALGFEQRGGWSS